MMTDGMTDGRKSKLLYRILLKQVRKKTDQIMVFILCPLFYDAFI